MGHDFSVHLRAAMQLHKAGPKFFAVTTLHSVTAALTPYVAIFFSAQILKELALLRRTDVLWQWIFAGVLCTGLFAVLKAFLYQRNETLLDDLYGRKEILFAQKMFSLDYADIPIAEAEIYSKFNDIAGDKTAIYISHRLSSCKFCDEIAVFHEGAIIQHGTHAELLADENGKYYELWNAQAQYYTE